MTAALPALVALAVMLLVMPRFVAALKELKFGQTIYELGPEAHRGKQGTPNMGGIVIALSAFVAFLLSSLPGGLPGEGVSLLLLMLSCMAIGFVDDYIKDAGKKHEGLRPLQKIIGQFIVGALFSLYCARVVGTGLHLPFSGGTLDLGAAYVPLMTLLVVFMTNSANLQDGVDGILSVVTVAGVAALGLMALSLAGRPHPAAEAVARSCFALVGACAGFLKFNRHPAKIFMGDTGSMLIGGAFAGAGMLLGVQLWLIPICFTLLLSSLSVIVQRLYFKATGGKRLLRMSPLHHHFELGGMSENRIVLMYGATTLLLSALALLSFLPLKGR